MQYLFVRKSANAKTGRIPVTYSERSTCPQSCPHIGADCYAEGYYTRIVWNNIQHRGKPLSALCEAVAALPVGQLWRHNVAGDLPGYGENIDPVALGAIVRANIGRKGFTYTHKKSPDAIKWARHANNWGFTINLSADDAGEADTLADTGLPVVSIVPVDCAPKAKTPKGRTIVICPAQTRDDVTCESCGLCARADRRVIIGFRAHGTRARVTDALARRVIPISVRAE